MARRTGSADLPLHGGRVPAWLGQRMASLGVIVCQAIVHHYGRDEFLQRLSHPFCFQSFGAVMGMDWHSSGITTSVIGALKRGLAPLQDELGIHACAGRGQHSRKTPDELGVLAQKLGFDGEALIRAASAGACRWPTLCAGSPGFPGNETWRRGCPTRSDCLAARNRCLKIAALSTRRRRSSRPDRIGNPTQGCKPRRRIGDALRRPLQRRVEVDSLLVAGRQPESPAIVDIEHDMRRRAAGQTAAVEDPCGAKPIEP